ncbi:MAG: hypothetical protein RL226_656 [Bacteroidota bacterium]
MGVTRTDLFTEAQNELAMLARVLGHPARIAILQHLIQSKVCINGDLVEELGLAQPTISQHLRELKEAGIIQGTIEGTRVNYCIEPEKWEKMRHVFSTLFDGYTPTSGQQCC